MSEIVQSKRFQRSLKFKTGSGKKFILGNGSKHSFAFLNTAQFLGALNDNLFKFLSIYLLIDLKGSAASNDILFWIGIAFVLPFLLFSTTAGVLADRFSKQRVIILLKALEVVIIGVGFFVYYYKIPFGCYSLVFMLCLQSALMGPSKYSIIPEIVRPEKIPKANGLITSFTYLACILGTLLASAITQLSGKNFMWGVAFCMVTAICGFVASIFIPYTEPKRTTNKISPLFLRQVIQTFKFCKRTPRLRLAVIGSAFFLFLGAYLQLNIIPFAIDFLGLDEVGGGYLFSGCAIGIAIGSAMAGRACKRELDLGLSCFALMLLGVIAFILPFISSLLIPVVISMCAIGLLGGLFVVPLESYMQAFSPSEMRGQVIALSSFLSFVGLLLAPMCLLVFGKLLGLSSAAGFTLISFIILAMFIGLTRYLSSHFLHFLSRYFVQPFYDLHFIGYPFGPQNQEDKVSVVVRNRSKRQLFLLFGECSKFHIFVIRREKRWTDRLLNHFVSIDVLYSESEIHPDPADIKNKIDGLPSVIKPIFVFTNARSYKTFVRNSYFENLISDHQYSIRQFKIRNVSHFKRTWLKPIRRPQLTCHFEDRIKIEGDLDPVLDPKITPIHSCNTNG